MTHAARVQSLTSDRRDLPHAAALLAYAGGLPLFVAAILAWFLNDAITGVLISGIAVYGVILLAFFGGVRWGVAVMRADGPTFPQLLSSILPALIAAPLFFVEDRLVQLALLAAAIPLLLLDDLRATRKGSGAPDWYLGVRAPLTVFIEISLLLAIARLVVLGAPV